MTDDTDLTYTPATSLAERVRAGEVSPADAVDAHLARIERVDDEINAFVTVTDDVATAAADEVAAAIDDGEDPGPLAGVSVALKDLRDMKEGVTHTFGSALFADVPAPRTTAVVERLEAAGAVPVGKTNVPEFGHKGATDNELVGATASPVAPEKNAGGSSGGSAAAVAAGMATVATGSDAGGSIRIPASACGVFGLKPSYGLVPVDSRPNGFGTKTHHVVQGPLTRTVGDAALLMDVLSGPHPRDPASVPDPDIDYRGAVDEPVNDLAVAYSSDLGVFPVSDAVAGVVDGAVDALASAGADVEEATVDHDLSMEELADAIETTFGAAVAGTAETLSVSFGVDLRDHGDRVSDSLLELIALGDETDVRDVAATGVVRTQFFDAVQDVLADHDLLVTPTLAVPPLDLHTDRATEWEMALTWPFNWTGHPAASVPAGTTDDGLPVGMQVVGRRYEDDTVLAASAAVERERPWHDQYPE